MRKLFLLLLFLPTLIFAQVPQGVGYQGVATDAAGFELINQSISIRASVISSSATGTIEWQEIHNTSTDTFGLFNLTIGQGTSTGNGAQTSFADINWGANTHFLKIEMDVNGGTNYSHMGTNQMMSVPYALYAENANINYDSISTLLSNDSTFITSISGGNGGGCNLRFPEGLNGTNIIEVLDNNGNNPTYQVPMGKRLYILNAWGELEFDNILVFGAQGSYNSRPLYSPLIVDQGQIISNPNTQYSFFNGFLVDYDSSVQAISVNGTNNIAYTVPNSKKLIITHVTLGTGSFQYGTISLEQNQNLTIPIIITEGTDIVTNNSSFNGYLVDENYFADCGGGGSSSTSIDSTYIDSLVQFYSSGNGGGGCDYKFPDGLDGEMIAWDFNNGDYNVPSGKNLFISNVYTLDGYAFRINGMKIIDEEWGTNGNNNLVGGMLKLPLCAKSGDIVSNSTPIGDKTFYGLLVDEIVEPITFEFDDPGTGFDTYTVPVGKKLYIMNIWAYGGANYNSQLTVDGVIIAVEPFNKPSDADNKSLNIPLIINSGSVVSIPDGFASFNGYLADENYFADCGGGGGGSSSSGGGSNSGNGSGCDVIYPEGYSGEILTYKFSSEYIVPSGKNLTMTWLVQNSTSGGSEILYVNGKKIIPYIGPEGILPYSNQEGDMSLRNPFIFSEGDTLSTWITNQSSSSDMIMNGFLTDKNVESVIHSFCEDNVNYSGGSWQGLFNYTVPAGKKLFIQGFYAKNPANCDLEIDGDAFLDLDDGLELPSIPMQFSSGQVLSLSSPNVTPEDIHFIGYLVDENYFADCGGGGGSSSSTIDSSYIDSLVQYYVSNNTIGGCNIDPFYPDGMEGVDYTNIYITNSTPYTVPANKTFYLYTNYSSGLYINGQLGNVIGGDHFFPIPVGEGIEMNLNGGSIAGYLIDKKFDVINYLGGGTNYTVPNDMYLYVLHAPQSILINSSNNVSPTTLHNNTSKTPLVFQPGDIISSSLGISGLLIPIDYCNQTGLTSVNSSNSVGSCDIEFPDGLSSTIVSESINSSNTYSVPTGKSLYITQASLGGAYSNSLKIDGVKVLNNAGNGGLSNSWVNNSGVIIAPSGSIISSGSSNLGQCQINGLLVNEGVEAIAEDISITNTYSVPTGKSLYITQASLGSVSNNSLKIDGVKVLNVTGNGLNTSWENNSGVIIAPSGSIISSGTSNLGQCQINGYLVDSNYFSNCNGGGSSGGNSSSTPNKLIYTIDGF